MLPYLKIITSKLDKNVKVKRNAEIRIGRQEVTANKHYVVIDQKMVTEIAIDILKKAKNDKNFLDLLVEEMQKRDESIERKDLVDMLEETLEDMENELKDIEDNEEVSSAFVIAIYKQGIHAVAITLEFIEDIMEVEESNWKVVVAVLNEKKESYMGVALYVDEIAEIICGNFEKIQEGFYEKIQLKVILDGEVRKADFAKFALTKSENNKKIFEDYENNN